MLKSFAGIVWATLWEELAPWHSDPEQALRNLQAKKLAEYDLLQMLRSSVESSREAIELTQSEGDEHGLLEIYEAELAMCEEMLAAPMPTEFDERLKILRRLNESSGQGIGNILDLDSIGTRDFPNAERLHHDAVYDACGSYAPTLPEAHAAAYQLNNELNRGQAVCFAVYEADRKTPVGWYFVGNTID